jgi:thiamine biosynthesis lipoprotein
MKSEQEPITVRKVFPAMGTVHTLAVEGEQALVAAERIKERIQTMDQKWSVFRENSEITALNRGASVTVSEDTLRILKESVRISKETGGAFDITAGSLTKLWRQAMRDERIPDPREIPEALRHTGATGIRMFGNRVKLKRGRTVDLGGIAKGYALDRALELLKDAGTENAILNLGGTIGVTGRPVEIGIRNPFDPDGEPMGTLLLDNRCAVTSGSYERFVWIGGRTFHHIIDPRTGYPSDAGLVSVTLVGSNATILDAFATAAFILGPFHALPLLKRYGIEAIFIKADGKVLKTEGLSDTFQFRENMRTA